jgi:L-fuconolactonase
MADPDRAGAFGRIFPPNETWLAKARPEQILEPALGIVDPHHHFWDRSGLSGQRYLLEEWRDDVQSGHNIEATVFIECETMYRTTGPLEMRAVGEVAFVAGLAAKSEQAGNRATQAAAGIVGLIDLTLAERVEPVLIEMEAAGDGRFRGIRHGAGWDADPVIGNNHAAHGPGLYLQDDFRAGLDQLSAHGYSLDALVFHTQLADLVDLARARPEANIIANHTGMPLGYGPYAGKHEEVYARWQVSMKELAACPNVSVKLGGMMMRVASFDYHSAERPPTSEELAALWRPFIEPCIEWFGADRCMFESNFPVDKMGIGYAGLWNAFKRLAADASSGEKSALFAGTARRAYKLNPKGGSKT